MTPRHHLDPATLVSHAAGALSPEMAAVADTHLEGCAYCRQQLAAAERVGGVVINGTNNYRPPVVPFGGVAMAGTAREGSARRTCRRWSRPQVQYQ